MLFSFSLMIKLGIVEEEDVAPGAYRTTILIIVFSVLVITIKVFGRASHGSVSVVAQPLTRWSFGNRCKGDDPSTY